MEVEQVENDEFEKTLQKEVEETLCKAATHATALFHSGIDVEQLIETVSKHIDYGDENEMYMNNKARQYKATLHQVRSQCLFQVKLIFESLEDCDEAVCVVRCPNELLVITSHNMCANFCNWARQNFYCFEQNIKTYFDNKKQRLNRIRDLPEAETASMILSSQSCKIAQMIWSLNRSLMSHDDMADLLVEHAQLCLCMKRFREAEEAIDEAYGYGGNSLALHRVAAKVGLNKLTCASYSAQKRVTECEAALKRIYDGLQLSPNDAELTPINETISKMLLSIQETLAACNEKNKSNMDKTDEWLPDHVRQSHKDNDARNKAIEKHKQASMAKSKKERTKFVNRRRPNEVSDSENEERNIGKQRNSSRCTVRKNSVIDIKESVDKREKITGAPASRRHGDHDDNIRYAMHRVIGTKSKAELASGSERASSTDKRRQTACAASTDIYCQLVREFDIHLGCNSCIDDSDASTTSVTNTSTGSTDYFVRVLHPLHHRCREDRLLLRVRRNITTDIGRLGDDRWIHIRPCPPSFRPPSSKSPDEDPTVIICESFTAGEQCREKMHCPFAHGHTEHQMWMKLFGCRSPGRVNGGRSGVGVERFVADLSKTALRLRLEIEQLYFSRPGELRFSCQACHSAGKGCAVGKRQHKPECENGHPWSDNQKLVYALTSSGSISKSEFVPCSREERQEHQSSSDNKEASNFILECVVRMASFGFTDEELVVESRKLRQRISKNPSEARLELVSKVQDMKSRERSEDSVSSFISSGSGMASSASVNDEFGNYNDDYDDDENPMVSRIRDDPMEIYDDSDLDGVMSVCGSSDAESSDDDAYADQPYYVLKSRSELHELIETEPDQYKRCIIHLDGPYTARCRMLDEGLLVERDPNAAETTPQQSDESLHVVKEVELRGRINCGPCFDGDEVVVELKKTKELDGDRVIYRGTVVGILKKNIVRKNHTFLCQSDAYLAHLMKPLDGVAPKIHVMNSIVKRNYPERRHELVAVYKMVDGDIKLVKIVKLDPKKRRDMLFVVKYLSWLPGATNMYPLGFVTRVIRSGDGLESSQRIINLLHQIPTRASPNAAEAAAAINPDVCDADDPVYNVDNLCQQLVITIDPLGCQDVDDALSIRKLPTGGFMIGVHIADVGRYVRKGDVIDRNASRRVTSFYSSTKKVYHMLPERLSKELCSLRESEDHRVVSVYIETDSSLDVVEFETPIVKRSIIRNRMKMTYEEAQQLIDEARLGGVVWNANSHQSAVVYLHYIAKRMRMRRLHEGRHFFDEPEDPFSNLDQLFSCEAHQLIEEFMIKANSLIARMIISKFPDEAPIRRQKAPLEDDLENWCHQQSGIAEQSFYFRQFEILRSRFGNSSGTDDGNGVESKHIAVLESTIRAIESLGTRGNNLPKIAAVIGAEKRHPLHALAMKSWFQIQESAEYVCFADCIDGSYGDDAKHFSLDMFYVQFTSPIRRFMDLVVHRFVVAALDNQPAPYTADEVRTICSHVNHVNGMQKKYSHACHLLSATKYLNTPFFLPCVVADFDEEEIKLLPIQLPPLKSNQCSIKYSQLLLSDRPTIAKDKQLVTLDFQKRFYDARAFHQNARNRSNARQRVRLETERHTFYVAQSEWRHLLKDIVNCDPSFREDALYVAQEARIRQQNRTGRIEVTSEMLGDEPMVRHHVHFTAAYRRGTVIPVQYGVECRNGYIQPVPRLLNLTPEKDLCIEHRTEPIACFAELATEKVVKAYHSIEHYQRVWLPILSMEAAVKAVSNGDSLLCDSVPLSLIKRNDTYYGKLYLTRDFCKKRCIKLFQNSKEGEEETSDYMCIRYNMGQNVIAKSPTVECTSFIRNVWVGHAVAQYVHVDETGDEVCVEFKVVQHHTPPPDELVATGKRDSGKCAVEFITKLLPDRRMEDAVKSINESSDLCKSIVLCKDIESSPAGISYPVSDTYDIDVESNIKLKKNNKSQTHAIREALKGSFTLIQGPPGTGKTLTGVKLVYWYVHMNEAAGKNGESHGQVLYCGPSNSSVDVAAKMLKNNLGNKCPKIIRVYSEMMEKQVFPVPRDSAQIGSSQRGRRYELIDKDEHHDIALHHLIRKKTNKFHNRIKSFDKLFRDNRDTPEEVSDKQIEEYTKLITDAAIDELQRYDVILCTCAASASPRMIRGANVRQLVIDEGGMCMEPECLVPLKAFKSTKQVVVIGDHRQLQPIVMDSVAKDRGLDISLFERYKERAIMLTHQYRMHPRICEFPSRQFYEDKLETAPDHECRGIKLLPIWPRRSFGIPMVFCHVEGAEKSLSVTTAEGNEQSKSNDAERDEAVRIFLRLVNSSNVNPNNITVLSQYRAQCSSIEQNLKDLGFEHPNVNTVIASQGDEWDYVILSLVRSMPQYEIEKKPSIGWKKRNMGFIVDEHQINVALTRARLGLIIVGNKHLLRCDPMWRDLLNHYYNLGCIVKANEFLPSRNRMQQQPREVLDMQKWSYDNYGRAHQGSLPRQRQRTDQ